MHARAAVKFVQLATTSHARSTDQGRHAGNGKSIMGLLTLVAALGTE